MKNFLLIGAAGQVGNYLFSLLNKEENHVIGTYLPKENLNINQNSKLWMPLDITKKEEIEKLLSSTCPDIVFLPAALTNVEFCEQNPQESFLVNVVGVYNVLRQATNQDAKLIFFSSDYIFDGKNGPYSEDAIPNPLSIYGLHKLIAEYLVLSTYRDSSLIVRTTVVYGWDKFGKNFVQQLILKNGSGKIVKVPYDQFGNPTYALDLAKAVVHLVKLNATGLFNVVGSKVVSRYDFALEIANVFNLDKSLILPVSTNDLGQIAKRPLKAGLTSNKFRNLTGYYLPDYHDGLVAMLQEKN